MGRKGGDAFQQATAGYNVGICKHVNASYCKITDMNS
jgi:hypothetical protein